MTDKPKYYDRRSDFWKGHFESARPYADYLDASPSDKAEKWRSMEEQIPGLTEEQTERLADHHRTLNVLVYSGVWCGDCVRQGPMLREVADAAGDGVDLRFVERDTSEELQDELRILGALRVPVVVFLTEDFHEIGRFGDRLLTVYRAKAERELGPACSTGLVAPPPDELAAEMGEWVDIFERMLLMARLSPPLRERYGD
jgi:thiol-disulfide isomerase/thioredoxin